MAIYEHACSSCVTTFEVRKPMAEAAAPARCPNCGLFAARILSVAQIPPSTVQR
jgi:putative FmdB family regulatory protein